MTPDHFKTLLGGCPSWQGEISMHIGERFEIVLRENHEKDPLGIVYEVYPSGNRQLLQRDRLADNMDAIRAECPGYLVKIVGSTNQQPSLAGAS